MQFGDDSAARSLAREVNEDGRRAVVDNPDRFGLFAATVAMSFVFIITFDPFKNWNLDDYSYQGITTAGGFVRNLFVDGFHPVLPWVAFYLFGMWLGRTDLRDPIWRRTLAIRRRHRCCRHRIRRVDRARRQRIQPR